jgi:lysophospholipase L1-like esterase
MRRCLGNLRQHRKKVLISASGLIILLLAGWGAYLNFAPHPWEAAIRAFELQDRQKPVSSGGVLFVGSSSIRLWETLETDFPGVPVIKRGFGGSQMADLLFFADRIIVPYRPRLVVIYEGDNDIQLGKTPERLAEEFRRVIQKIHEVLPETRIAFIAIKPSPQRWDKIAAIQRANALIQDYIQADPRLAFIDVYTPMLNQQGRPRPELFQADQLHLNATGYQLWRQIIAPYLHVTD